MTPALVLTIIVIGGGSLVLLLFLALVLARLMEMGEGKDYLEDVVHPPHQIHTYTHRPGDVTLNDPPDSLY